ncbi:MAG: hypothetical protein ACE5PV_13920 [Candidatus Poribacteria bacterium]
MYELVAVDREQALTDVRFKNLPHIVEVIITDKNKADYRRT